jgi:hypothetical protein
VYKTQTVSNQFYSLPKEEVTSIMRNSFGPNMMV